MANWPRGDRPKVEVTNYNGIGFVGILQILFIALKLTGHIDWSWLWVLAPIWVSTILWFVFLIIILVIVSRVD